MVGLFQVLKEKKILDMNFFSLTDLFLPRQETQNLRFLFTGLQMILSLALLYFHFTEHTPPQKPTLSHVQHGEWSIHEDRDSGTGGGQGPPQSPTRALGSSCGKDLHWVISCSHLELGDACDLQAQEKNDSYADTWPSRRYSFILPPAPASCCVWAPLDDLLPGYSFLLLFFWLHTLRIPVLWDLRSPNLRASL